MYNIWLTKTIQMSNKKYSRKHIGTKFTTKQGYDGKIIDGGSRVGYCTIQIEDWITEISTGTATGIVGRDTKKVCIKYPFHKSVNSVGYIGIGPYSSTTHKKLYQIWQGMLGRSYSKKCQIIQPTYIGCSVHRDWHNLQIFGKWFEDNYIDGWDLDKDLLFKGNKIYSKETCVFIPSRLNRFLSTSRLNNTSGFTGVYINRSSSINPWVAEIKIDGKNKHIGSFNTKEEANEIYKKARKIEVEKLKVYYKDTIDNNILDCIY